MTAPTTHHHPALEPAHIVLVTTHDCHFCAQARNALERLGHDYPLEVQEIDLVSPRGRELAAQHGILFPPGLLLDGAFVGFGRVSEGKLRHLLAQRAPVTAAHQRVGAV
jgi:hypothetical protein